MKNITYSFSVVSGGVSTLGSTLIGSSKSDGDVTINITIGSITAAAIDINILNHGLDTLTTRIIINRIHTAIPLSASTMYYITLHCILPLYFYHDQNQSKCKTSHIIVIQLEEIESINQI